MKHKKIIISTVIMLVIAVLSYILTAYIINNRAQKLEDESADGNYTIKVLSCDNKGLLCDINAFNIDGMNYVVLPDSCDLSLVKYTVFNSAMHKIYTETFNFQNEQSKLITVYGFDLSLTAVKTKLPVMHIDVDESVGTIESMNDDPDHYSYCYGDMCMYVPEFWTDRLGCAAVYDTSGNDKNEDAPGTMKIRGRGNTSWQTGKDKQRPYQIKLEKGLDLLGMGENKSWALLRSEDNFKYYTNKIADDMAADFGIQYSPRAAMIEVYLNGKYLGMYTLSSTVTIGDNSVPITDIDDEIEKNGSTDGVDLTGGYLLEIDNNPSKLQFFLKENPITVKSPKTLAYDIENEKFDYIISFIGDLFDAVYGNGYLSDGRHFSEVLDIDSAARYILHQELVGNYDCGNGSTFFYKDCDSKDSRVYIGPVWDNDVAFEILQNDWCIPYRLTYFNPHPTLPCALCKHKIFVEALCEYYYGEKYNLRSVYLGYADKIAEYEKLYNKSASMTSKLYNLPEPKTEYISKYIMDKCKFTDIYLNRLKNNRRLIKQ